MKKKTFRTTALMLALATALSVTACGKSKEADSTNETQDTSEWYDVSRKDMDEEESRVTSETSKETETESTEESSEEPSETETTGEAPSESSGGSGGGKSGKSNPSAQRGTTEQEYYEEIDAPEEVISPDVEIFGERNMRDDAALYNVKVNGKVVDIRTETIDSFIRTTEIRRNPDCTFENPFESIPEEYDGVFWFGGGYGIYNNYENESLRFQGTMVFLEGMEMGFVATDVDPNIEDKYKLRCVYTSIASTKDDFTVQFAGGIQCGMTRADVEAAIGKGNKTKSLTYYANAENALLIRYGEDDTVTEIYLYNDFAEAPIQYYKSEEDDTTSTDNPDGETSSETTEEVIYVEESGAIGR